MTQMIEEMVGKTFNSVKLEDKYKSELTFKNAEEEYVFYHMQDCCEGVWVEEIHGDLKDLEDSPLLRAEEITSFDGHSTEDASTAEYSECHQWTFYKFATIKGEVVVRWLGESNGYYSTSVDMRRKSYEVQGSAVQAGE